MLNTPQLYKKCLTREIEEANLNTFIVFAVNNAFGD
jgi:hypothetical protein